MKESNPLLLNTAVAIETVSMERHETLANAKQSLKDTRVERDARLDFVKGFLVVVMVAYHVMDYFVIESALLYKYLHFVSGAFIFTTGYVVAEFYVNKYARDKRRTCKRLVTRGLKLIGIFTVANLMINYLHLQNFNSTQFGFSLFFNNLIPIFIYGNGHLASFEVLPPIGYLLIVAPLLLMAHRGYRRYELALISAAIVLCWVFGVRVTGPSLVILGLGGFMFGTFPGVRAAPVWSEVLNALLLAVYLSMLPYISQNFITYVCNVLLVLKFVYDLSRHINLQGSINHVIVLFGQYSLFCYFAQILFLQFIFRFVIHHRWPVGHEMLLLTFVACIALFLGCRVLEWLRAKSSVVNSVYKLVFA